MAAHRTVFIFSACILAGAIGCDSNEGVKDEDAGSDAGGPGTDAGSATGGPFGGERYIAEPEDDEAAYLFDQDALRTYELFLGEEDLAFLDADPAAEQYVPGELVFEGESFGAVGIRYKGAIGAFFGCVEGSQNLLGLIQPSGAKTCTKLSMKVKVNWEDPDRHFHGVKKLQFHSLNLDASMMHERLAYWLVRAMGIPAPRSVHARLFINGEYSGLYALTEQIDGRFTRSRFADGKGNLYKEVWPLDIVTGQAEPAESFIAALKTNEDENPSAERMRAFAGQLAAADDTQIGEVIERWRV